MNEDQLDLVALERLEVLQELLKTKALLAETLKAGFFELGKARNTLGMHSVSALRIPTEDLQASVKVVRSPGDFDLVAFDAADVVTVDDRLADAFQEKCSLQDSENETENGDTNAVRQLNKKEDTELKTDSEELISSTGRKTSTESSDGAARVRVPKKAPICWFSALPPQSLRSAQTSFASCVRLSAACVTLQGKLQALSGAL